MLVYKLHTKRMNTGEWCGINGDDRLKRVMAFISGCGRRAR